MSNDQVTARETMTILEVHHDGHATAYSYRITPSIVQFLLNTLGPPDQVMGLSPAKLAEMRVESARQTTGEGIERWTPDDDHMPEAMWPDDRWTDPDDMPTVDPDAPPYIGPDPHEGLTAWSATPRAPLYGRPDWNEHYFGHTPASVLDHRDCPWCEVWRKSSDEDE
jgi:hypothetical protein